MRNYMKALAAAAFAVLFVSGAHAQGFDAATNLGTTVGQYKVTKTSGKQIGLSSTVTNGAVDFGFVSDYVSLCLAAPQSQAISPSQLVLARFGTGITNSAGVTTSSGGLTLNATSMTIFESGDSQFLKGRAMAFSSPSTASISQSPNCYVMPFQTQGIVLASSGNATVNVIGFGK